jgi:hypothetical protein
MISKMSMLLAAASVALGAAAGYADPFDHDGRGESRIQSASYLTYAANERADRTAATGTSHK